MKKEYMIIDRKDKYILDENNNVIPADLMTWSNFFEDAKRRTVKQETVNDLWVSTVFLGLDHNFYFRENNEYYKPHVFETMIFKGVSSLNYQDRYSTWKEAEEGHQKAIQWIKDGCKEEE